MRYPEINFAVRSDTYFGDNLVESFSLGDGPVNEFVVNVIFHKNSLGRAGFFIRPRDIGGCALLQQTENLSGNLYDLLAHFRSLAAFELCIAHANAVKFLIQACNTLTRSQYRKMSRRTLLEVSLTFWRYRRLQMDNLSARKSGASQTSA